VVGETELDAETERYVLDPSLIEKPQFYINVEFCSLKIIKNKFGIKCGFALTLRDTRHDLIIVNQPNEDGSSADYGEHPLRYLDEIACLKCQEQHSLMISNSVFLP
jgi:hypothetical protein